MKDLLFKGLILTCLAVMQLSFIRVSLKEGIINSVEGRVKIEISTNESPVYGVFTADEDLALYANVYGNNKKMMGDINLTEHKVLELKGKGKFLVELYSLKGKGKWKCRFYGRKEFRKLKINE